MRVLEPEELLKKKVILHKNDEKILALLCSNVRLPISKIAQVLRLSRQSAEYRIRVMQQHHLLAGSRAVINIQKLGYNSYHFFMTVQESKSEKQLIERCQISKMVNALISYSGKWDYELSIMAKSPSDAMDAFLSVTEGLAIIDYVPTMLLKNIKSAALPEIEQEKIPSLKYIRNDPSFMKQFFLEPQKYTADEKDIEILYYISQDCQLTLTELGRRIKLTNDAIAYRIKKLIRGDYILRFRPVIDFAVMGLSIETILIRVRAHNAEVDMHLANYLKQHKNILWATSLFGAWNCLVYFIHERQEEIHEFINDLKKQFTDYLISYEVLFAYRQYKYAYMTEAMRGEKSKIF